jgi:hypothetical protein
VVFVAAVFAAVADSSNFNRADPHPSSPFTKAGEANRQWLPFALAVSIFLLAFSGLAYRVFWGKTCELSYD